MFFVIIILIFGIFSLYAENRITGQIIVELENHIRGSALDSFVLNYDQYEMVEDDFDLSSSGFNTRLFNFNHELVDEIDFLTMIRNDPLVRLAQFNFMYEREIPDTTSIEISGEQWALENLGQTIEGQDGIPGADISAKLAWQIVDIVGDLNPNLIQVAVIDEGFSLTHPDLNFATPYNATMPGGSIVVNNHHHGAHVSGIIGSRGIGSPIVYGVYPNVKMIPIQAAIPLPVIPDSVSPPSEGNTNLKYIIRALQHVYERKTEQDDFIIAVNICLGGYIGLVFDSPTEESDYIPIIRQRINDLGNIGILTIRSAGNNAVDIDTLGTFSYLPSLPYLIGVANTNNRDELNIGKNPSNYGLTTVHLGAPGTSIYSTSIDKNNVDKYAYDTGTSMSAPHVSGTVALMYRVVGVDLLNEYSSDPGGLALFLKEKLLEGVDPIPSLTEKTITGGRLNAKNAVLGVLNKFERITEDKTIDNEATIDLKKFMIVSSSVIIEDAIIMPIIRPELSSFYGFELYYSSQLELINTTLYLEDGFIRLDEGSELILDENSKIYISGGNITIDGPATITMFNGAEMIFTDNSSLSVKADASLTLNNVSMSFEDSEIETGSRSELLMVATSQISLSGGALNIAESSQLTMLNGSDLTASETSEICLGAFSSLILSESTLLIDESDLNIDSQADLSIDDTSNVFISASSVYLSLLSVFTILNDSELTLSDESVLTLSSSSIMNLENSTLSTTDSKIFLLDFSSITLDNSEWIANGLEIRDYTDFNTVLDPYSDDIPVDDALLGIYDSSLGGIYINNSYISFDDIVIKSYSRTGSIPGLFLTNSKPSLTDFPDVSKIIGAVSGLHFLSLYNSHLIIEDSEIGQMGSILSSSNSHLEINSSNITKINQILGTSSSYLTLNSVVYEQNRAGITNRSGLIIVNDSIVSDSGSAGITIGGMFSDSSSSFSPTPLPNNKITNSTISDNLGPAVEIWSGLIEITDSELISNTDYGLISHSTISPNIHGKTKIQNTVGLSEISGRGIAFPSFHLCETDRTKPLVGVIGGNASLDIDYLLMAMGDSFDTILAYNLDIDRTDLDDLLYPYWRDFEFDYDEYDDVEDLFLCAERDFDNEDFMDAYYKFMHIITYYPDTIYAVQSIPLLPYVYLGAGLSLSDLLIFLGEIDHPNLYRIAQETIIYIYEYLEDYLMMIYLLDILINDPDTGAYEKLVYTALQMHAHYQATLLGLRSFESLSVYQPSSIGEYQEMLSGISESIMNLLKGHEVENPDVEILPSVTTLHTNYPNPFNPITTISFDLAVDSIVSIDIYNIRGQRVKTITNEHFTAGSHRVEWNGTDENGREVSSGVFFYRMQAEGFTQVRRMVLLK